MLEARNQGREAALELGVDVDGKDVVRPAATLGRDVAVSVDTTHCQINSQKGSGQNGTNSPTGSAASSVAHSRIREKFGMDAEGPEAKCRSAHAANLTTAASNHVSTRHPRPWQIIHHSRLGRTVDQRVPQARTQIKTGVNVDHERGGADVLVGNPFGAL